MEGANGGERNRTKHEREVIMKKPGTSWQDGPCRECKCEKGTGLETGYEAHCTTTECPLLSEHADRHDYDLQTKPVRNQCCPSVLRTACKHQRHSYPPGQTWSPDPKDPCTLSECIVHGNEVQIRTKVKTCDTKCELGWELTKPLPGKCCGVCQQVACVLEGIVKKPRDKWTSKDKCTLYKCVDVNGSLQVQSNVTTCPIVSDELKKEYKYEYVPKEGECCGVWKQRACKVADKIYDVGEIWPSPDGDKCKEVTCVRLGDEISKQKLLKQCNTDCALGWEYKPAEARDDRCCGECEPVACVVNGTVKGVGSEWESDDGCTSYRCSKQDGAMSVISSQEHCPDVSGCPEKDLYVDGCCTRCKMVSSAQTSCLPEEMPAKKSVKLIKFPRAPHGLCFNPNPIKGFTECVGSCHSATRYNPSKLFVYRDIVG